MGGMSHYYYYYYINNIEMIPPLNPKGPKYPRKRGINCKAVAVFNRRLL